MSEVEASENQNELTDSDSAVQADEELLEAAGAIDNPNLDVILGIPIQVSLELGRTKMDLRDLMQLGQGSVVELNRLVDEPMDVLVNGKLIAHGEVVVIDNKFGIRLTDIVSPEKRVQSFSS